MPSPHAGIVDLIGFLIGITGNRHIAVARNGGQQHGHAARIHGGQHQRIGTIIINTDNQYGKRLRRHILIAARFRFDRQHAVKMMHIPQRSQLICDFLIGFKHAFVILRQSRNINFLVQQTF